MIGKAEKVAPNVKSACELSVTLRDSARDVYGAEYLEHRIVRLQTVRRSTGIGGLPKNLRRPIRAID